MCRNISEGGRRCPHQSNPVARAKRNAERRANYKVSKLAPLLPADEPRRYKDRTSIPLSKAFIASITAEQQLALQEYAEMESGITNKYLYDPDYKEQLDDEIEEENEERRSRRLEPLPAVGGRQSRIPIRIQLMDEAIAQHTLPEPVIVYNGKNVGIPTGIEPFDYIRNKYKVGDDYSRPSYISASTNPSVAASFTDDDGTPVVYEFLTSQGAPIREIPYVLTTEDEIIVPRDKKFTVVGVRKDISFDVAQLAENDTIKKTGTQQHIIVVQLVEQK